ncbi:LysR family transcriptional regulator [Rhizobium glycinendophyticum]|uniref:HTH-type transcriptional regulator TtuA n=1 Tax=Rhizobium glycinendophyticum TaxID=2589807 RepID=A0A504TUA5_9HYPH|nr:LysR family transcriptional regulator [Rhizobium glycinendophyticum]TPP05027.1 LysR family transcriptional regulator [Rhizobium glycinendophyticum]
MKGGDFIELTAFLCVTEERSFRRAATRMGMSPSALSHTIRALEQRLGARLLNRTTRSVAPTEAGLKLYSRVRPAIDEINDASKDVGTAQTEPRGLVRINLPRIAARLLLTPMLPDFAVRYPDVRLELVIDDGITDIVREGFDVGIRSGELVQQDMIALRLTPDLRMIVVGSPAYFAKRTVPRHPRELREHRCLAYRWDKSGALQRWEFQGPDGVIVINVDNVITANETDFLLDAARSGFGLANIGENLAAPYINSGELVQVLVDWTKPLAGLHLYYVNKPHMPAALRAFIDAIKSASNAHMHVE